MRARVDLEVLGAGEHLAAVGEAAGEGLLPGVDADVVDELVLRFERLPAAQTLVPHADVTQALEPRRDVLGGDVVDQLVHGAESLVAHGRRRPPEPQSGTSSVDPFAHELRFDGGAFGEIQQAAHPPAAAAAGDAVGGGGGDASGSGLRRRDDARSPGVVVPQRRDEAIVPGSRPLHAQHGGSPRSRRRPRRTSFSGLVPACGRQSACGDVVTPRCSASDPESRSLHAFIYCVNGGQRSRRNTAGRGPTLFNSDLVSPPSRFLVPFCV